jgi:pimeloyl-ACP methyl ester carboxylesterase
VVFDADLIAVLDAAGAERQALVGAHTMGSAALRFSALHPELVAALVLFNAHAHYVREDDYPWGFAREDLDWVDTFIGESRGTATMQDVVVPGEGADERSRAWSARMSRVAAGPDQIAKAVRADFESGHRRLLPTPGYVRFATHYRFRPDLCEGGDPESKACATDCASRWPVLGRAHAGRRYGTAPRRRCDLRDGAGLHGLNSCRRRREALGPVRGDVGLYRAVPAGSSPFVRPRFIGR